LIIPAKTIRKIKVEYVPSGMIKNERAVVEFNSHEIGG